MIEKFGIAVEDFFKAYGTSFLMMIVAGFIIAFIVEIGIKKAFAWLEKKLGEKAYLAIAKMAVIFSFTILGSGVSVGLIFKAGLPLPGNAALAPFWFFIIYIAQYVFSMKGIKGILALKDREKKEKPAKEKKASPVEGMKKIAHNVYKAADGSLYNRKGEKI